MDPQTYTVQQGDTLSKIARSYGVSIADVSGYRSGDPNLIRPGEKLTIGKTRATPVNRIDASNLNQGAFTPPPDVPKTAPITLQSLAESTTAKIEAVQPQVDSGRTEIKSKYDELGKQATARVDAYANEQTVFGTVNESKKELQDINSTIKQKELAHRRKVERIQNENPTGQLTEGQRIAIEKADREWASEAADLSLVAEVKLGNYTAAKGIIDSKVDAATEALKNEIASLEFFYRENFDQLSDLQKTQLQQQTDIVKQELEDTQSIVEQTGALQLEAAQNGAPADIIMAIGKATDITQAIAAAGQYIGLYDRNKQDADGGGNITYSDTQIANGAAAAGVTLSKFQGFDKDTQNFFINGDISGSKKSIDDAFLDQGATLEEVQAEINGMGLPAEGTKYLIKYAEQSAKANSYTIEDFKKDAISDLTAQKQSGMNRADAYDAVKAAFLKEAPLSNEEIAALNEAIDTVYGKRTWLSRILPGGN